MKVILTDRIFRKSSYRDTGCIGCGSSNGGVGSNTIYLDGNGNKFASYFTGFVTPFYRWCDDCYFYQVDTISGKTLWDYWCSIAKKWHLRIIRTPDDIDNLTGDGRQ